MLNLNEMAIFTRVVDAGSFSGAARLLGLPKSTISRKVALLEEHLGVRLLQRTTRVLKLTEIGTAYYAHCSRMVNEAEEATRLVSQMQVTPRGQLRVTAPTEFGSRYLGKIVATYLHRFPEVRVEIDLCNRVVDIIEEGFDLAIRGGTLTDSSLIARKLVSAADYLCASPGYLAQHGIPTHPERLERLELISYAGFRGHSTKLVDGQGGTFAVSATGKLLVNSLALARDAALAGYGLVVLPEWFCWEELQRGQLQRVLADWTLAGTGLYAVYPTPRHLSTMVRSFIELLAAELNPPPWKNT